MYFLLITYLFLSPRTCRLRSLMLQPSRFKASGKCLLFSLLQVCNFNYISYSESFFFNPPTDLRLNSKEFYVYFPINAVGPGSKRIKFHLPVSSLYLSISLSKRSVSYTFVCIPPTTKTTRIYSIYFLSTPADSSLFFLFLCC